MFAEAIQKAAQFTRAIHTISRSFASPQVTPGAATLFFVNEEGYALTCKHVVQMLQQADALNKRYHQYKQEKAGVPEDQWAALGRKYGYKPESMVQLRSSFVDCVDQFSGMEFKLHPKYDLALIKFNGFRQLGVQEFAVFPEGKAPVRQGDFLCRLGFPFPEFSNYGWDGRRDEIVWTAQGKRKSPQFPIEGMVTRFLADRQSTYGIEMSRPGLKGQSGGPLFTPDGVVVGMQSMTKHLHLGFDIEGKPIRKNGKVKKVDDYSFLHLGICIHADVMKAFMEEHGVGFVSG